MVPVIATRAARCITLGVDPLHAHAELAELDMDFPLVDDEVLDRYVAFFIGVGFFPPVP
ncbi:hypothetical protein DFR71_3220 [Nocardia alba]|uniref:Uncharacterized protein n=1 Tax=Nocardia alba TaxID=225051 RepID=A0A4R1FTW8_9NOCA|nr:hypothetical protein DFR71_3220 [Nocardia alba]